MKYAFTGLMAVTAPDIRRPAMATLILAAALAATPVYAADYQLSIVAQDGDVINGHALDSLHLLGLSLNNSSQVVFGGHYPGASGIFTPSSQLAASGQTIGGHTLFSVRYPWINDSGDVVFHGAYADGQGIFTPTDALAVSGDVIDGQTLDPGLESELIPYSWSNSGLAAFNCSADPSGGGNFTQNEKIAVAGDTIDGRTLSSFSSGWGSPSVNAAGTVVFEAGWGGGVVNSGVFSQTELILAVGDTIGGKTLTQTTAPKINDAGNIVFLGLFEGGQGLFTPTSLLVSTGDTIGGQTIASFTDFYGFTQNNAGDVAFLGGFAGGEGLFTRDSLIAATGDVIDGNTIEDFWQGPVINDAGQVLFSVRFTDGRGAVILATPEPSTLVLLALAALALPAYIWRKRTAVH